MKPSQLFSHWKQIRRELLETADKFTDADLTFTPFDGSWTVGEILCHIAAAEEGWFRHVIHREIDKYPEYLNPTNYPTLETIKNLLTEVHARTEDYLNTLTMEDLDQSILASWGNKFTLDWIIWHVIEYEIHHRGELSLILGILGRDGLDV